MFSRRLDWSTAPNPISTLLEQRRAAGERLLDLTESNPTRAGIHYEAEAIAAAFADPRAVRYEPTPTGLETAREAVGAYYAERGVMVAADRVLLTASTSEAYAYLFKLLADPGDEILVPRPSYPLFEYLARLESIRVVHYPVFYDHGWHIDCGALESALTGRSRAIVLVNPNNPTGSYLKRRELDRLMELCAARELALISDEVFSDYSLRDDPERVASIAGIGGPAKFALSGLSKIVGLPQMKLAWMTVSDAGAFERLELIADTYLSVGTPVQLAAPALLSMHGAIQNQIQARARTNLYWLRSAIPPDWSLLDVEGGWYATVRVPRVRSEQEWALHALHQGVLVQPGYFYDFEDEAFLVLSLLTEPSIFKEGVGRIREAG